MEIKFTEHDVTAMRAELAAVHERAHKLIRVREVAACHKLEQMRRVQPLESHGAWTRKVGFDRIKVIYGRQRGLWCMRFSLMIRSTPKLRYILTRDGSPSLKNSLETCEKR